MPIQAMAAAMVWSLARTERGRSELRTLCEKTGVPFDTIVAQLSSRPRLFQRALEEGPDVEPAPEANAVVKELRDSERFRRFVAEKMSLGSDRVMELGNLYTASLLAWVAAGLEEADDRVYEFHGYFLSERWIW